MLCSWLILILGGLCEALWAFCLGKSRTGSPWWFVLFAVFYILSAACLSLAVKKIPVGTAYAVWTGIGATCTIAMGIVLLKEPVTVSRMIFILVIFIAVVGLQVTTK